MKALTPTPTMLTSIHKLANTESSVDTALTMTVPTTATAMRATMKALTPTPTMLTSTHKLAHTESSVKWNGETWSSVT